MMFDHIGFTTSDIHRSIEFWVNAMGFRADPIIERDAPWVESYTGVKAARIRLCHIFSADLHVEFIQFMFPEATTPESPMTSPASAHVCIRVEDPAGEYDRLIAAGASPAGRVTLLTEGKSAGLRGGYLRDPCGVYIELLEKPRA